MTSPNSAYASAVLAIYLVLSLPAVYTAYKHGVQNRLAWLGWGYFILFCILRITGSAMQIADPESSGAAIISSVGLSPLIIGAAGILHEGRSYFVSHNHNHCHGHNSEACKIGFIFVLLCHILVAAAIALLATGASGLSKPTTATSTDPTKINNDWHLAGGGAVLLLLLLAVIFGAALFTYFSTTTTERSSPAQRLVLAVITATPLLAIRVLGTVVYFFGKNGDMNPSTGTWGFRAGLYLVPEVLAAVLLLGGGLATLGGLKNSIGITWGVDLDGDVGEGEGKRGGVSRRVDP